MTYHKRLIADMPFTRESSLILADEIGSGDSLSLFIRIVRSPQPGKAAVEIADAEVDLWVMIEDSCSIVRQVNFFVTLLSLMILRTLASSLFLIYCRFSGNRCVRKGFGPLYRICCC